VELDEEHVFASPMLCNLEEIADAGEATFAGETRRDLFEGDRDDGIDFNLAFFEAVSPAGANPRMHPDANAFRDRTTSHAVAQVFREQHRASLTLCLSAQGGPAVRMPRIGDVVPATSAAGKFRTYSYPALALSPARGWIVERALARIRRGVGRLDFEKSSSSRCQVEA